MCCWVIFVINVVEMSFMVFGIKYVIDIGIVCILWYSNCFKV